MELVYGVMVTQLFLVQSFKVRVLVDQQKTPQAIEEFFYLRTKSNLYFESNHRSNSMIYQILTDASVEEMRKTGSSVRTHSD